MLRWAKPVFSGGGKVTEAQQSGDLAKRLPFSFKLGGVSLQGEEVFVNTAIATGHWGILPTGYMRPDTLTWHDPSQIEWVQRMNRCILETKTKTAGA
jgi:hypothetical protein